MTTRRGPLRRLVDTVRVSGPLWTASVALDSVGVPTLRLWAQRTVAYGTLAAQVAEVLRAWGMSDDHAAITVEHLLYADLYGIDSHGCGMLLHYHRERLAGSLSMTPRIEVVREDDATAIVDGGGGLGHVPADLAMKLAIEKCAGAGIAAVAVRNSNHFGAAGAYARLAARAGFLGFVTTNTASPAVVPTFGTAAMLGTNPVALAAPASRNLPFLLDMATSTVPVGRLMTAWRMGRPIPAGWAVDAEGRATTDARLAAKQRRLTPLGSTPELSSHKGYGLAAAVEILTAVLPGTRTVGADVEIPRRVGHFFLVLDPRRFRGTGRFEDDLDAMMDSLRECPPSHPDRPVLVAGDPEYAASDERLRNGIPLTRAVVEDIRSICAASGASFMLDCTA